MHRETLHLAGGFWSLIGVVQTLGMPALTITRSGSSVVVSWPDTAACTLQQSSNLAAPAGWAASGYTMTCANGTNSVTLTPAAGSLFFRLRSP